MVVTFLQCIVLIVILLCIFLSFSLYVFLIVFIAYPSNILSSLRDSDIYYVKFCLSDLYWAISMYSAAWKGKENTKHLLCASLNNAYM